MCVSTLANQASLLRTGVRDARVGHWTFDTRGCWWGRLDGWCGVEDTRWAFLRLNRSRAPRQASSNHGDRRHEQGAPRTDALRLPMLSRSARHQWLHREDGDGVCVEIAIPSKTDTCSSSSPFALGLFVLVLEPIRTRDGQRHPMQGHPHPPAVQQPQNHTPSGD